MLINALAHTREREKSKMREKVEINSNMILYNMYATYKLVSLSTHAQLVASCKLQISDDKSI